jgi:hypothetical protein
MNIIFQIKMIKVMLEDATLTDKDVYLAYIDYTNVFGSINYARLLVLIEDLARVGNYTQKNRNQF